MTTAADPGTVSNSRFTTPRLTLRPIGTDDAGALFALLAEPGVRKYLCDGEILPRHVTDGFAGLSASRHAEHGYGLWAVERCTDPDRLIGISGLWSFREPPELELLYAVSETSWGGGLAVEAASAILAFAFDGLGMDAVRASTDAPNVASIRVMEKLGMTIVDRRAVDGRETVFAEVRSAAWPRPSWWSPASVR